MKNKRIYFSILFSFLSGLEGGVLRVRSYISPGCEGSIVHTSYESSLDDDALPANFIQFETTSSSIIEFDSQGGANFILRECEVKDEIDEEIEEEEETVIKFVNEDGSVGISDRCREGRTRF